MPIARLYDNRKMSQNLNPADRAGVIDELSKSDALRTVRDVSDT